MNKNVYTIPPSLPFADTLAQWILQCYGTDSLCLPEVLLLLPSRRACLAVREAFLRATGGKPTLLPRMQPLGEVEGDRLLLLPDAVGQGEDPVPPPGFATKRLFILARLIRAYQSNVQGKHVRMDHAVQEARDIALLLDRVEREKADLSAVASLVPERFATHWQHTVGFLSIIAEHWPAIAREKQIISAEEWRNRALTRLADAWTKNPPDYPVIAAGTTGSIASTAALLSVIARLEKGAVVLPGLDKAAGDAYMAHISESHAQWGMQELLHTLKVSRQDVQVLGEATREGQARETLLSQVLCPAEQLADWRNLSLEVGRAVQGMAVLEAADAQEEAEAIALMLREVLESPGKTAALVTHDRRLARRVAAEMLRYGVQLDDSAGKNLADTPAATFLRLLLEVVESQFSPVKLLALLKHPLAFAGERRLALLETVRALEKLLLHGVCLTTGIEGLRAAVQGHKDASPAMLELLLQVEEALAGWLVLADEGGGHEFAVLLEAHLCAAEKLAGQALWQGNEGEALYDAVNELRDAAGEAEQVELASYPSLFNALLVGKVVRPDFGMHPRLKVLSPLEARMQVYDRIILGGMNEGSWPPLAADDPWFNRSMRKALGLAMPERQTGQAAHDFAMLACAPDVAITRANKVDGTPTTPARWLVRLMALLGHCGLAEQVQHVPYLAWLHKRNAVASVAACARPAPIPPLDARPREVAVTQVETWISSPYEFYCSQILKLRPLDPISQDPSAANFGIAVHKAIERFTQAYPSQLPPDCLDHLLRLGQDSFAAYAGFPLVRVWWWPRFEQLAAWFSQKDKSLRPELRRVLAEVSGRFELEGMTFTGRADRIEETRQGTLAIVDYKTGGAHSITETRDGQAVQLMLLALMAQEGMWEAELGSKVVERLEYWIAGGGRSSGEVREVSSAKIAEYAASAKASLVSLIHRYQQVQQAYYCANKVREQYTHLARVQEWH